MPQVSSPPDTSLARIAMVGAALALAQQVGAKSVREGLFLSSFSVTDLPKAMLVAALCAIPTALLTTRFMKRWGPQRVTPVLFFISAAAAVGEWLLVWRYPRATAVLVYLHVSVGGAVMLSTMWSLFNERFDPHSMKRLVGRLGASATFGGLAGGAVMERAANVLGARDGLLVMAAFGVGAAISCQRLASSDWQASPAEPADSLRRTSFTSYMWTLALLVLFSTLATTFADFALKHAAAERFEGADEMVRFFAMFYTGAALVGFLLQVFVSRRVLEWVGIGGTLAVSPIALLSLGSIALVTPSLVTIAAMRGMDLSLGSSLFRSAYEPLFTPVAAATKRSAKALIDVLFDKGGEALASLMVLSITLAAPALLERAPVALAAVAAFAVLWCARRARRGYVEALAESLRGASEHPDAFEHETRLTISATATGFDRQRLLEKLGRHQRGDTSDDSSAEEVEGIVAAVRALLGSDAAATRHVLQAQPLDSRLAAFVVPLLARDNLARPATKALRSMGLAAVGVLGAAMLDNREPLVVRRRVPIVISSLRGERVIEALTAALDAQESTVRERAGLALLEVLEGQPHPDPARVLAKALSEATKGAVTVEVREHVLTLLATFLPRAPLNLVRQGLRSEHPRLRGTALEYLEALIPDTARLAIVGALAGQRPATAEATAEATKRDAVALQAELERSFDGPLSEPRLASELD